MGNKIGYIVGCICTCWEWDISYYSFQVVMETDDNAEVLQESILNWNNLLGTKQDRDESELVTVRQKEK